eukprot:5244496-Pyramimonas_sp.AAC.1
MISRGTVAVGGGRSTFQLDTPIASMLLVDFLRTLPPLGPSIVLRQYPLIWDMQSVMKASVTGMDIGEFRILPTKAKKPRPRPRPKPKPKPQGAEGEGMPAIAGAEADEHDTHGHDHGHGDEPDLLAMQLEEIMDHPGDDGSSVDSGGADDLASDDSDGCPVEKDEPCEPACDSSDSSH